jgi:hypothetical protein
MPQDIQDLALRFKWTSDGKFDSYRILDAAGGPLEGDCDDFAVTALWLAEGKSMLRFWWALLTFRAVIWYVRGKGFASHVVLWHRKHGWIDNQNPTWGPRKFPMSFPAPIFMAAFKMLVGKVKGK